MHANGWHIVTIASIETQKLFHTQDGWTFYEKHVGKQIRVQLFDKRLAFGGTQLPCNAKHLWLVHPDDAKNLKPISPLYVCDHQIEKD
jgi:hypothetical protein